MSNLAKINSIISNFEDDKENIIDEIENYIFIIKEAAEEAENLFGLIYQYIDEELNAEEFALHFVNEYMGSSVNEAIDAIETFDNYPENSYLYNGLYDLSNLFDELKDEDKDEDEIIEVLEDFISNL